MMTHPYLSPTGRLLAASMLCISLACQAQSPTELDQASISGDIQHRLPAIGGGNLISADETIAQFNLDAGAADGVNFLGNLDGVAIDGYHQGGDGCGPAVYSLDSTATISGNTMRPGDIFQSNGVKIIDAQIDGIPDGVNVNAVSRNPENCDVVFSVDVHAQIGGLDFSPDDLIAWNSGSGFTLFLVGNMRANIDALHLLDYENRLLFSVETDIELSGLVFRDEDIIEQIPGGPGAFFELSFTPAPFDMSWGATDIDALWALRAPFSGQFQWEATEVEVFETESNVSVMITRTNGSEGSVDVSWGTNPDSATAGMDYVDTNDVLTLGDGVSSGMVSVPLLDDGVVEGTEVFYIRISTVTDGSIGSPQVIDVIIRDDEDFVFADSFEN